METTQLADNNAIFKTTIRGGGMWSTLLRRHRRIRFTDIEGGANLALICYNRENYLERYNMSDTLKAQHIARLCYPYTLHSDMGRVMLSIIEDSIGWHDTIGGVANAKDVLSRFGAGTYQDLRNDFYRNGRDNFLIELGKWGMGKKDLVPNLNGFSKVTVDANGCIHYHSGHSPAGSYFTLRAEMDVLLVMNTCHHPMDPTRHYSPKPVAVDIYQGPPAPPNDPCRCSRPENERAFLNTENYLL